MPNIVVIGAGVSGLTTALLLAANKDNKVTIVARHMPGDYDIEYTSPWAGANVLPMADEANSRWERETWPELKHLAANVPEAGIHFQKSIVYRDAKKEGAAAATGPKLSDALFERDPWFRTMFDDFRELEPSELPADKGSGAIFTSVCINTALYLPWLVGQCRARGVVFRRAVLAHVADAAAYGGLRLDDNGQSQLVAGPRTRDTIVVNCSGLLACRLGGVADDKVVPARGQVVVVRNELTPMIVAENTPGAPEGELLYAMQRAVGGGTILGGTYQVGNWESQPDPNTAVRILARVAKYHPQMKGKTVADLDVIRHGVGLRPYRKGGVRIETEKIADGPWVVHNYGHAGWGYQGSYGCSKRVVELVDELVAKHSFRASL